MRRLTEQERELMRATINKTRAVIRANLEKIEHLPDATEKMEFKRSCQEKLRQMDEFESLHLDP